MAKIELSQVKPDFDQLVAQMQQAIIREEGPWTDLSTSSMGQVLLEMIASVGTFNQYAIESSFREAFLHTAVRDSSIYAIANTLGVRISRKIPSQVTTNLVRLEELGDTKVIPPYNQFNINGQTFFNRDRITFAPGVNSLEVQLYQGEILTKTVVSDGTKYQQILLEVEGFNISDVDVQIVVEGIRWTRTTSGLWLYGENDRIFYDSTTGMGDTSITFGDGNHGKIVPLNTNIDITYVTTIGASVSTGTPGSKVKVPNYPSVEGVTLSGFTAGANEKDAVYYKFLAPHIFKAKSRAVTKTDHEAIALTYPNVSDVKVLSQRDIDPNNIRWMNTIRIIILPDVADALTDIEKQAFLNWFQPYQYASSHIDLSVDPIPFEVDIEMDVYIKDETDPNSTQATIINNISDLFKRDIGILGRELALSDIVVSGEIEGVDYVVVKSPHENVVMPKQHYFAVLRLTTVNMYFTERRLME